jgi:hypothetical protein
MVLYSRGNQGFAQQTTLNMKNGFLITDSCYSKNPIHQTPNPNFCAALLYKPAAT